MIKKITIFALLLSILSTKLHANPNVAEFLNPPDQYKTGVWWHWIHGCIDEEGIRADLDHMKNMGISLAVVFHIGSESPDIPPFSTEFLSPRWQELFRYAVEQAALRNIEIGLNMCDGWTAGGPWITPEYAVSTGSVTDMSASQGGPLLDPFNKAAMDLHWENIIERILDEAGQTWVNTYVGSTFKYTQIDSWEGSDPQGSPALADEFLARRGYALGSRSGQRYIDDFDLTRCELWAENHWGYLSTRSHAINLQTHSEAAGPIFSVNDYMADRLRNIGTQDIAMGEFWTRDAGNNIRFHNDPEFGNLQDEDHMKTVSSAAHIYGKRIVQAEAFTREYTNFTQSFWDIKDVGDRAFCQGLNRNVFHSMVAQAGNSGKPGYNWVSVGSEFSRNLTYWPMGKAWISYLNRCHYLLQQGTFVGDFLYFHGVRGPVKSPAKFHMEPDKPEGYDCDLVNAHALLTRASATGNRVTFPDGQSYRYLVMREDYTDALTPAVLQKLLDLVTAGVTLIGPPPERIFGYEGYPESDQEFENLKAQLWTTADSGIRTIGAGRVIWGYSLEEVLNMDNLPPDLEIIEDPATDALPESVMEGLLGPGFDYIHRKIQDMDVYFVSNLRNTKATGDFTFRDGTGQPQIWNPIDGSIHNISGYKAGVNGGTKITLNFEPRQSFFVVFGSTKEAEGLYHNNEMAFNDELTGPWQVAFNPAWGGPASVEFASLMDWKDHSNNGIKYYSGTATYTKTFDLPTGLRGSKQPIYLDLGDVKDMAEVTLNGIRLGVVWCEPFQIKISGAVRDTGNALEVKVVNRWSNRLLGDKVLNQNYTTGNATHAKSLFSSGLLGPVKLGRPVNHSDPPTPNPASSLNIIDLKCEYKTNPLGIDVVKPRLSWKIGASQRGTVQTAYSIRAAERIEDLPKITKHLWNTGKVKTDQSVHVVYDGPPLKARQRVYWQVQIWDNHGGKSGWSEPAWWEMGLLKASDWQADWIEPNLDEDENRSNPCLMLRKEFEIKGKIKSARAYITCHGLYEMQINGKKVGEQVFTPGWTSYHNILQYQVYDITDKLKPGTNCIGVILGDGWYRGRLGWNNNRNLYGKKLALLAQIEVINQNDKCQSITSDKSWKVSTGPILLSDIYDGEVYEARLEKENWSKTDYDDSDWTSVTVADHSKEILVAPAGPPIRKIEQIRPVNILTTPAGQTVVDMGQNMVGRVRISVQGPIGTKVKLVHAEVLDSEGNFYVENLRSAKQTVEYILKGQGIRTYESHFTFQGFRYVLVEGWPGEFTLDSLTGIVIHSDITPTGTFECSDIMLNQLQHNIIWGQKGNFLDVPTDCPQRDERMGWTGDAQVFARTACFNADVAGFFTKWLADLAADQQPSGAVPHVIPNVLSLGEESGESASAGWADAAVVVPWTMYLCYGDKRILEQQYSSMKAWVDYMVNRAGDSYFWNTDETFGDWLAYNEPDYPGATTPKDLIRQAYFVRSTDLFARISKILEKKDDHKKYSQLLKKIKKAFLNEFVTPNGRLASDTQTSYSLAIAFDLLPDNLKAKAAQRLAENVDRFEHITTGFLGTPLISNALSENGYLDQAYMLLNRQEYPSWLYPITKGATTIWERWDGLKPDGTFQDEGMNSFNHYAYGAIGDWLYRVVAGLDIDEQNPGYKHIIIQPHPGGGLTYAKARHESLFGSVESGWHLAEQKMVVNVEVPANTTATIRLPKAELDDVKESGKSLDNSEGITDILQDGEAVVMLVGSGRYSFEYPW